MNKLNYTEEIFNILSRGGFISNNSVQARIKRYYDAIEDHQAEYDEYYQGIGFHLEAGDGYFFFTRKETKVDLLRKLEAVSKWIDYLTFEDLQFSLRSRFGILCGGYRGENQL